MGINKNNHQSKSKSFQTFLYCVTSCNITFTQPDRWKTHHKPSLKK